MADAPRNASAENASPPEQIAGLVAEFPTAEALRAAAEQVRDHGFTRWDVHSPFPVHGIERAMGMRPTPLPWLVLAAGVAGGVVALGMQWWMNAVDYPLVISGKPLFSLPANIPVMFELVILFAALAAFGGTIALNRLPQFSHFAFRSEGFRRVTTDGWFITISAADPKFDEANTPAMFESLGATAVEVCRDEAAGGGMFKALRWAAVIAGVLAVLPPLFVALAKEQKSDKPRIHAILDMDFQPSYRAQAASPLFADHRATRPSVAGTIAVGDLSTDEHLYLGYRITQGGARQSTEEAEAKTEQTEPEKTGPEKTEPEKTAPEKKEPEKPDDRDYFTTFPPSLQGRLRELMDRGQARFDIYCATCHGLTGDGNGMTQVRVLDRRGQDPEWVPPTSLHAARILRQPVGQLFNTITNGTGKMPAYAAQIPVEDRWAIVLYMRALQRSQNASVDDVPEEVRPQLR